MLITLCGESVSGRHRKFNDVFEKFYEKIKQNFSGKLRLIEILLLLRNCFSSQYNLILDIFNSRKYFIPKCLTDRFIRGWKTFVAQILGF